MLISIKEAATKFPFSESWFRHAIMVRSIPFIKCGRKTLIDDSVFEDHVKSFAVEPRGGKQ